MAGDRETYARAMRIAADHSRKGNWKAAGPAYRQAIIEFPQDLAATLGLGDTSLEVGQLQSGLEALQRAAPLAPEDTEVLSSLADVRERLGMLEQASVTCTRMGSILARQNRLEEAADLWMRASRLVPDQIEVCEWLARTLEKIGRPAQAAAEYATLANIAERRGNGELVARCYHEALRLDPGNNQLQMRLASLQSTVPLSPGATILQNGHTSQPTDVLPGDEENMLDFESLVEEEHVGEHSPLDQAERRALQELADLLFAVGTDSGPNPMIAAAIGQSIDQQTRGLFDDAIESLRQAIDAGLSRTAAYFHLGALYYERGHHDNAIESFRHSMRDKEYTLGSHYGLGLTYHAAGNVDRALEHFIEVAKMVDLADASPEQAGQLTMAYQRLTDSYIAKGDTEEASVFAQTLFQFFSDRDWEEESRQARRAMDSISENNDAMALAEYLETPETEITVTTLALTAEYMQRNMLMTAVEECYRAIQKAPASLRLYARLADILMMQGRTRQAITMFLTIADTYQVRGEIQNATNIYQEILNQAPMDVQARARLIELLVDEDEIEQALEHYLILADTYYQTAEVERALTVYGEALGLVSRSSNQRAWETDILYHMGDIFEQRVEWARAIAAYESIVAIAPRDERALLELTYLYFKQGQREKALRALDTWLDVHRKAGATQTLLEVLQEVTQAFPEESELHARLASACVDCGLTRQAIDEYAAVGKMQLEAGQRAEAVRTIQTIIDLGPEEVDEYRQLLARMRSGGS